MGSFINAAVILVVGLLVATILLQVRGQGGGLFGAAGTTFRTRRGVERTLFQATIGLAVLFVILAVVNLRFG
ncbi:MAG: preprotein translocase subunit SecG [Chloroflexota bacterium]|nr:preprotein translocase subunit SecG [Chloroflexota bacterium]